jgi:hypothetical protein
VRTVPLPATHPAPAPAAAPSPTTVAVPVATPVVAAATTPVEARASVQITSVPEGAMVQLNGASIGNTPLDFWLPSDQPQARLIITLVHHEDAVVLVTPTSPATIGVQLRARSSSSRSGTAPAGTAQVVAPAGTAQVAAPTVTATETAPSAPAAPPARPQRMVEVVDPWE